MSARRSHTEGVERLLIDGNNLLHRERQGVGEESVRGLLARLQRALPAGVTATVMLDGHPAAGSPARARISAQLDVRHAGSQSADDALLAAVLEQPFAVRAATVVVTDDRALTERVRGAGAATRRLEWLQRAVAGAVEDGRGRRAIGLGARRPGAAAAAAAQASADDTAERRPWQPGRGATRKRGNPRRGHPAQ